MKLETYYRIAMLPPAALLIWLPISAPALVNSDGSPLTFTELAGWYSIWLLPYVLATVVVHLEGNGARPNKRMHPAELQVERALEIAQAAESPHPQQNIAQDRSSGHPSIRARALPAFLFLFPLQLVASCGDDSAGVEVVTPVTITVTPTDLVLSTGASAQLEATVHDSDGQLLPGGAVQWSSSAPEIVSVSQTGIVTALAVGRATIGAHSDQSVGFGQVVVQPEFGIPVSSTNRWLVVTEAGSLAPGCVGNEGGLRLDGSRDCSHAGISRYSLDLADADQWTGAAPGTPALEVVAAADGTITDICIQPPSEVTCGDNGPFVLIEHEGGFSTVYAHLDPGSVSLRRKTAVQQGQRLGTMGAFGAFPARWLHFELRYENQGSMAASVLDPVQVSGRRMRDYRAGDGPDFLHAQRSVMSKRPRRCS